MAKNIEHESEEIEEEISKLNSLLDNNEPPSSYQIPFINERTERLDAYLAKAHARLQKARGEILRYRSILTGNVRHAIRRFKTYPNLRPRNDLYALSLMSAESGETSRYPPQHFGIIPHCSRRSRVYPLYLTLLLANFTCQEEEEQEKTKIFVGAPNTADKLLRHAPRWLYFDFNASWYAYHLAEIPFPALSASGLPDLHEVCYSIHTRKRRFG
ncbi:hypothetical protein EV368DRAFT_79715 [Lentinula lateritia]|uniref:Uncharacterized protein n=1 Tax=Lentinula aff. lateritia TaxID=2804960 RepID=A0ACC1U1V5_9AGAR|nr:hypothetical protein F5876DRAFT_76227 [Lentinula aff. lateritia]KAJ3855371.1 hypothetical protein EV368DRAFT_79715 [Lentinula lateritia]